MGLWTRVRLPPIPCKRSTGKHCIYKGSPSWKFIKSAILNRFRPSQTIINVVKSVVKILQRQLEYGLENSILLISSWCYL